MVEVEFLDSESWQDPDAEPDPARRAGRSPLASVQLAAPAVLWLAAAALLVAAPFRLVYSLSLRAFRERQSTQADGWGRLNRGLPDASGAEHGPRLGIVLCVAAGLLLLAAGLATLAAARGATSVRIASAGSGLAGVALAAGTAAAALLDIHSVRDNLDVELRSALASSGRFGPGHSSVHLTIGAMIWLTAIGVACGLAALVLQALRQPERAAPAPPAPAFMPTYAPEPHPQDELLDSKHHGRRSLIE